MFCGSSFFGMFIWNSKFAGVVVFTYCPWLLICIQLFLLVTYTYPSCVVVRVMLLFELPPGITVPKCSLSESRFRPT